MQFVRKQRHGPRVITPRQLSAYERSCRAKREKLPLVVRKRFFYWDKMLITMADVLVEKSIITLIFLIF